MQPYNSGPSAEGYSTVNRRPLDVEDYFDMVRRHKAWILGPAFAGLVIATVVACLWPNTYVSTATIRVVPPQVPETYVQSNVNSAMSQRINSMYQTVSSRGNLTNIINLYNLYPGERSRKPMEDVVEDMRRAIAIADVGRVGQGERQRGITAFQISFTYENRIIAQKVCADLVSRFMTENTRESTQQSIQTTQFLKEQLENAKKELETIENRLASFRTTSQGRLPDQLAQNATQLAMHEQRIANLNQALARVAQQRMLLEADLRTVKSQRASLTPPQDSAVQRQKNERLIAAEREIMVQEATLSTLRQQYRDNYPEVRRVQAQLSTLKQMRDKIAAEEESATSEPVVTVRRNDPTYERELRGLDAAEERLDAQLKATEVEAKSYQNEIANAEKAIRSVQSRIESTPVSEQQYSDIIRDREMAKMRYDDMNKKRSQSQIAEDLVRRQQGETLELLDAASLPQSPTQPKRLLILGGGTGVGLILGLLLAGAREAKDTSLKNLKDVRAYTQLPILGSVPLLENDLVVRRRKRLTWLAWSTACLVGIVIMTGSAFYYYATKV
jgi:polysaccharide chain length determinant protein (PEP-CTERM system associated)